MNQNCFKAILALIGFTSLTKADGQFKSRPDLSPPRLNITIPATEDVDRGYIFACPYSGFKRGNGFDGPEQPACYIFRDDGDLVWSSLGYLSGWVGNLQVRTWKDETVITAFQGELDEFHGHGFGQPVILNRHYEHVTSVHGGNHQIISIHEFNVLSSNSALVEIYEPVQTNLAPYNALDTASWIVNAIFQEIDLDTGKLLFEWNSLNHVSPAESAISLDSGHAGDGLNSTDAWDYFHINSVDKDFDGNYLISARHASTIYKINGSTSEIIWRLGGRRSDFTFSEDVTFGFQHDARFIHRPGTPAGVEYISLFDNSARAKGHQGDGLEVINDRSRAKILRLDWNERKATAEVAVESPDNLQAASQGNVQILPNSNLFVGWGQGGAMTEYRSHDSQPIFHAYLDSDDIGKGVQSYRAFRFPWRGYPREAPAITVIRNKTAPVSGLQITVYVSWNGDTEAVLWKFYSTPAACAESPRQRSCSSRALGEAKRLSFETKFAVDGRLVSSGALAVFAEAIDTNGRILVTTTAVPVHGEWHLHNYEETDSRQFVIGN